MKKMKNFKLTIFLAFSVTCISFTQTNLFSDSPSEGKFILEDLDSFWLAFNTMNKKKTLSNPTLKTVQSV